MECYIWSALRSRNLIIEVQVVGVNTQRIQKPPIEYDRPNDQHGWRDHDSQESYFRRPAEKEAISPRRGNEKYDQGRHAYSKANDSDMYSDGQFTKDGYIVQRTPFRKAELLSIFVGGVQKEDGRETLG